MNRNEFIQMIYDDFERMFPETAKKVVDWYVSGRYSITIDDQEPTDYSSEDMIRFMEGIIKR